MVSCLFQAICDTPQISRKQNLIPGFGNRQFFVATKMAQHALSDGSKRCAIEAGEILLDSGSWGRVEYLRQPRNCREAYIALAAQSVNTTNAGASRP